VGRTGAPKRRPGPVELRRAIGAPPTRRRHGWERLGHASLFAFLTRELGLSKGAAYLRFTAARLLPRHPAVEASLRSGALCLSAVGELGRVLTPENEADVLPRFIGRSAREAKEVVAALAPRPAPPTRTMVTLVPPLARTAPPAGATTMAQPIGATGGSVEAPASPPPSTAVEAVRTSEPLPAGHPGRALEVAPTTPTREAAATVEPLTADLRRLHLTVSARFLEKVAAARDGLSHTRPGASTEQVLEAALDLLLERQARRKALVKRPSTPTSTSTPASAPTSTPPARPHIPAHVEREVRLRDGDRCQYPLDSGGVCGSTWQVQLDHLAPVLLGGPTTAANLRCACAFHNRYAAMEVLGPVVAGLRRPRARRR